MKTLLFLAALALSPAEGQVTSLINPLTVDRVGKAETFFGRGQYSEALDVAQAALEGKLTWGRQARAYWLLGKSHEALGSLDKALSVYQVAVKLYPRDPGLLVALGDLFRKVGLDDRAMPQYQAALKADPDNATAHTALGGILTEQGLFPAATPHFKAALSRKPKDLDAMLGLGRSLAGEGKLEEAEATLGAGLKAGGDVDMRVGLAEVLKRRGKGPEAIEQLRLASLETKRADVRLRYAAWLLSAGRVEEGAGVLRLHIQEAPEDALARYLLGLEELRGGQKAFALKGFQAAADQDQSPFLREIARATLNLSSPHPGRGQGEGIK